MAAEFHAAGETDWPHGAYAGDRRALDDLDGYIRAVADETLGVNLAPGRVAATTWWLLVGERGHAAAAAARDGPDASGLGGGSTAAGRLVGTLQLRHTLNEYLASEGGHIGFGIRPSERGKGHATRFLRLALVEASRLGLQRVLLTCATTNTASAAVIRKCGGVLEDARVSVRHPGETVQRYWIDLATFGATAGE